MKHTVGNNFFVQFGQGFFYPFRAGGFLFRHPRLWKLVLIPFLINVVFFSAMIYSGYLFFYAYVLHLIPSGEAWYWLFLYYVLGAVAVMATAILVFFAFSVVGNLIASPFSDLLSERTEELLAGFRSEDAFSFSRFWSDAKRILVMESKKMAVFLLGMLFLLGLNLVPGIGNLLFTMLFFLLTVTFLALEYIGFVASRKRFGFKELRRYYCSRWALMNGFGTGVFALLMIPFLNFVCIPLGVIGAVQLWFDHPPGEKALGNEEPVPSTK